MAYTIRILQIFSEYSPLTDARVFDFRIIVCPEETVVSTPPDGKYTDTIKVAVTTTDIKKGLMSMNTMTFDVRKIRISFPFGSSTGNIDDDIHSITKSIVNLVYDGYEEIQSSPREDVTKHVFKQIEALNSGKNVTHIPMESASISSLNSFRDTAERESRRLPGMDYWTTCPWEDCFRTNSGKPKEGSIRSLVIHLNDTHKWTIPQIADWLDDLHENGVVDLSFGDKDELG